MTVALEFVEHRTTRIVYVGREIAWRRRAR
jgi:hypothetical protein